MKISRIETFLAPPRWMFVRVETDEGVVGWGEPVVEGRAEPVRAAVEVLAEYLLGQDPARIEDHWQVMTKGGFYRGGPVLSSAVAGLDQALWDIKGKRHGLPVHQLLGGPVREKIRAYAWVGGDEPQAIRDAVTAQTEAGFTAVKMNGCGKMTPVATRAEVRDCLLRAETAREVLGDERDFGLDFHGRVSPANARRLLPLLADYAPMFVEEPVLCDYLHALPDLVNVSSVPLALGERLFTRQEFLAPLQAGVAILQPDISHAGGISELRRIAALAEAYGAQLAPHCPLARSRWPPASKSPSPPRTSSSRNSRSGSTTTRAPSCWTMSRIRSRSASTAARCCGPSVPDSAWRWTRPPYGRRISGGTPGGIPCGAMRTGRSRNGDGAGGGEAFGLDWTWPVTTRGSHPRRHTRSAYPLSAGHRWEWSQPG